MLHGRQVETGQKVKVYVNLHKQGRFSVADVKTGLVCGYTSNCLLKDPIFHVNENGRQCVLNQKRKMVHAWVRGLFVASDVDQPESLQKKVNYNPYHTEWFQDQDGCKVETASYAYFTNKKVYIE